MGSAKGGPLGGQITDPSFLRVAESFEEFYEREYPKMLKLAYALSGNRWAAEEIAQEGFLAAHRRWSKISSYESPGAWLRRVVSNLSVSFLRRRVVETKALVKYAVGRTDAIEHLPERDEEVWRAVRSLPRRQAQAIALHYVLDLPLSEIASTLECAEGTVKAHLHAARVALANRLGEREGGSE
jgi:RNA polymerase sigma factor (sigma-70 family)